MFITFEGVEGSGKTTQIEFLKNTLINEGKSVFVTREPGGSPLGNKIREIILDPHQEDKPDDLTELLLYIADRAHHVETVIRPALEKGNVVLCDRYTDSTLAYQGHARGFRIEDLNYLNNIATRELKPDLTIIMDLDPIHGLKRVREQRTEEGLDRIELENLEFHNKVRFGFLKIAKDNEEQFKVIDANNSIEDIKKQVIEYVREKM